MLAAVGNDGNRFLVVSSHYGKDGRPPVRLETDSLSEGELQHRRVGAHLLQQAKPLNDPIVQVDQLSLGQLIDVDLHRSCDPPISIAQRSGSAAGR